MMFHLTTILTFTLAVFTQDERTSVKQSNRHTYIKILTISKVIHERYRWMFIFVSVSSPAFSTMMSTTDLFQGCPVGYCLW